MDYFGGKIIKFIIVILGFFDGIVKIVYKFNIDKDIFIYVCSEWCEWFVGKNGVILVIRKLEK